MGRQFRPVLDSIEQWGNAYIAYLHKKEKAGK
jgi:DNA-binding HxlR family transcriptional regulator